MMEVAVFLLKHAEKAVVFMGASWRPALSGEAPLCKREEGENKTASTVTVGMEIWETVNC